MSIRTIYWFGTCSVIIAGAALFVEFSVLPAAKSISKSSRQKQEVFRATEAQRQKDFIQPINGAIRADDIGSVRSEWSRYLASPSYSEDPLLRLKIARYFIGKGAKVEAHGQLDKILNPPKGSFSTLQGSGEVMSLWLSTAGTEPAARKALVAGQWQKATEPLAHPMSGSSGPTGEAKVEYLAGQELTTLSRLKEALTHYERSVSLEPGCSFLWKAVAGARRRVGDFDGAKAAMVRAYWTATPDERSPIKRHQRLADLEVNRLRP